MNLPNFLVSKDPNIRHSISHLYKNRLPVFSFQMAQDGHIQKLDMGVWFFGLLVFSIWFYRQTSNHIQIADHSTNGPLD